jgi:methionyl-tRNA formyltransferase
VFVFGTGRISDDVRTSAARACLNLHGGSPEFYRGLDSHLWAMYHDDFDNVVTTLHHVDADLDTGDIVFQERLTFEPTTGLHEVRSINTRSCVGLALLAVHALSSLGRLPARRQFQRGRYYSFMPAALKDICAEKLRRHLSGR